MSTFSAELYKAASGAQSHPISKARSDAPFATPVFEDYVAKNNISGYMTALWQGAAARDIECLRVLIYLAIKCHEPEDAMDLMDMLADTNDTYLEILWKIVYKAIQDAKKWPKEIYEDEAKYKSKLALEFDSALCMADLAYEQIDRAYTKAQSPFYRFGQYEPTLLRAYINNVGRQPIPEQPKEEMEIRNIVPQETKDYWRGLYARDDCSSNQEAIYHDALSYAEQGDPYAMYIVGYLLNRGIRTKYSHPNVTILEANHEKALPWLKCAADAGIVEACWEVACALWGACYISDSEENCTLQMRYYLEKGAEGNNTNCLEWLFKHAKSDEEAFSLLVRLAKQNGTHKFKLELAKRYEEGKGCAKDEKKAFELAEYVYRHSSASPYGSSYEDAVDLLCRYLREGIGCEPDPERAGNIRSSYREEEDRMWELLTK